MAHVALALAAASNYPTEPTPAMLKHWSPNATEAFEQASKRSAERDGTPLDCEMRRLSYSYALELQPERAPHIEVFDALRLNELCGDTRPPAPPPAPPPSWPIPPGAIYVSTTGGDSAAGTKDAPLRTPATPSRS